MSGRHTTVAYMLFLLLLFSSCMCLLLVELEVPAVPLRRYSGWSASHMDKGVGEKKSIFACQLH